MGFSNVIRTPLLTDLKNVDQTATPREQQLTTNSGGGNEQSAPINIAEN